MRLDCNSIFKSASTIPSRVVKQDTLNRDMSFFWAEISQEGGGGVFGRGVFHEGGRAE